MPEPSSPAAPSALCPAQPSDALGALAQGGLDTDNAVGLIAEAA